MEREIKLAVPFGGVSGRFWAFRAAPFRAPIVPRFLSGGWNSEKIDGTMLAMCKNPASILALRTVGTSLDFFAPRGA